jgi:hypothetical protein
LLCGGVAIARRDRAEFFLDAGSIPRVRSVCSWVGLERETLLSHPGQVRIEREVALGLPGLAAGDGAWVDLTIEDLMRDGFVAGLAGGRAVT